MAWLATIVAYRPFVRLAVSWFVPRGLFRSQYGGVSEPLRSQVDFAEVLSTCNTVYDLRNQG